VNKSVLKTVFEDFAEVAAPWLHIADDAHYEEALALVEALMEDAQDSDDDPLNRVIGLVAQAVGRYEREIEAFEVFETQASEIPVDVAMLRVLMKQHGLGVADFPEIGDKSLVSRILSGSRNLTKQHIQKLSERFGVSAGLFFGRSCGKRGL
jgi:HTH-type transcriptional regulator/antitoxin HigA